MYQNFNEMVNDAKSSGKDWIKSQIKVSAMTFVLVLVALIVADIICERKWDEGIVVDILIPFVALFIAIVDAIPVLGISAVMLPWAALDILFGDPRQKGVALLIVFVVVMLIKAVAEPFIRGKSLGVSPLEEVVAALLGFAVGGGVGLVVAPLIYTIGKKIYVNFKPDTFFANFGYNYLGNNEKSNYKNDNSNIVDITDDVEEVDD